MLTCKLIPLMKKSHIVTMLFTVMALMLITAKTRAQVVFKDGGNVWKIGKTVGYYIDQNANITLDQLIREPNEFKPNNTEVPNFGLLKSPVWLKIVITNQSSTPNLLLEFGQASFDNISFYYPQNGTYQSNQSGLSFPFLSRMIDHHQFIYKIDLPVNATATYYVRIESSQEVQLPILLGNKDTLTAQEMTKNVLFGIYFGIIMVMFFYNLFIYFTVKDPIYLYYVVYILIVGLTQATIEGYGFQYLWPNSTFFAPRAFFFFTALVNITGLEFVRKFLNTKQFIPRSTWVFYVLYVIYGIAIILTIGGVYYTTYQILQNFAGVVSVFMLVVAIMIARQGYRPAKFFFIAWIPLITAIIIYVLRDFNVIPYNVFSNYSITVGSAIEVILLSFALADRINILKAEKEKSQEETLNAIRENERIIREQNTVLEIKVNERTLALNLTLEDLKQAQAQLVESEKMASLGQLTAGIAHEINNPINFVTSNVSPLKRDVEMVFAAFHSIENIGLSGSTPDEKRRQMEEYKEELDFDYLKTEIELLLNGIFDGASRTAEIVKGLRIFSRLDEDDLKTADLNEGIESSLIILNNQMTGKIKLTKDYAKLPLVECYPGKLNQVFLNIISNAIYAIGQRYGEAKGGEIIISTHAEEEKVVISIKDNGIGMSLQTRQKLFDPFFTTKGVGEGTGLGMSIAYNTVKKHNGNINVVSSPGEGAEFIIKLPVVFEMKPA